MPIEFRILTDQRRTMTRGFDLVTSDDVLGYYPALRAHPLFDGTFDEVVDLSDVDKVDVDAKALRALSATVLPNQASGAPMRIAIIAPSDLAFGLARMYQALRSESVNEMRVFREADEAMLWIESGAA